MPRFSRCFAATGVRSRCWLRTFRSHRHSTEAVRAALTRDLEAPVAAEVDGLLADAGVPTRRRERTKAAILQERLSSTPIDNCWILRLGPGAPFWRHLRDTRIPSRLMWLGAAHFVEYLLWIAAWWLMGEAALSGRLDRGWLMAWALLLLTLVPLRLVSTWLQGLMGIGVGGLLKLRLLAGALRLEPDEIRHQGAGEPRARHRIGSGRVARAERRISGHGRGHRAGDVGCRALRRRRWGPAGTVTRGLGGGDRLDRVALFPRCGSLDTGAPGNDPRPGGTYGEVIEAAGQGVFHDQLEEVLRSFAAGELLTRDHLFQVFAHRRSLLRSELLRLRTCVGRYHGCLLFCRDSRLYLVPVRVMDSTTTNGRANVGRETHVNR